MWPSDRPTVQAGTLEVDALPSDPEAAGEVLVFDPTKVSDGIELSRDPILLFRPGAYAISAERRQRAPSGA